MAARALAAAVAGRRIAAGQKGAPPLRAPCRRGSSAQPEEQHAVGAGQVEAALNRKNVEVLPDEVAHAGGAGQVEAALNRKNVEVLPDEVAHAPASDDAWVPDQETGVFGPADEAAGTTGAGAPPAPPRPAGFGSGSSSVLDQTVFVREDDMEDVERPTTDMANADGK